MIRTISLLRRHAGTSPDAFGAACRDELGPLVAAHQVRLGVLRYVQTHRDLASAELEAAARSKRGGMEAPYDSIEEYWFASDETLGATLAGSQGRGALDELWAVTARICDLAASPLWFAHEYPQVSVQRERVVARARTGVVKVHLPLRPLASLSDAEARRYWLTVHGPLVRSHSVARGSLCYQQVHRYDSALARELAARRGCRVLDYLGHAEAWFDRLVPRSGAEAAAAEAAAIDDERAFIDWSRSNFLVGKELVYVDRDGA